jgi:hypothetical protein
MTCSGYAPLASPTFTGTVTIPTLLLTSANPTQLFFSSATTPTAAFSSSGGPGWSLSGGAHYNGTNWVADATTPTVYSATSSGYGWYLDSGKTVGSTYTPTALAGLTTSGLSLDSGTYQLSGVQIDSTALSDSMAAPFTPLLEFGGSTAGITYSTQTAYIAKSGKMATVNFSIALTSVGTATGAAAICGLPAAAPSTMSQGEFPLMYYGGLSGLTGFLTAVINTSPYTCFQLNTVSGSSGGGAGLSNANFTATSSIRGTFTYVTN